MPKKNMQMVKKKTMKKMGEVEDEDKDDEEKNGEQEQEEEEKEEVEIFVMRLYDFTQNLLMWSISDESLHNTT